MSGCYPVLGATSTCLQPPGSGLFTGQPTASLPQTTGTEPQSYLHVTLEGKVPEGGTAKSAADDLVCERRSI